jgi:hypothetical protein
MVTCGQGKNNGHKFPLISFSIKFYATFGAYLFVQLRDSADTPLPSTQIQAKVIRSEIILPQEIMKLF